MDVWQIDQMDITIRLVVALLLGGIIGLEREYSHHPAGFRTHILVSVGSALIMIISIYGFTDFVNEENVRLDPGRMAAQVISGIGFLGAGAIIRQGFSITGLTTAASLWVVAAIGLGAGAGFYFPVFLGTLIVLISLFLFSKLEQRIFRYKRPSRLKIILNRTQGQLSSVMNILEEYNITISNIKTIEREESTEEGIKKLMEIKLILIGLTEPKIIFVLHEIHALEGVQSAHME